MPKIKMLKIKPSQVLLTAIHGIGSVALGIITFRLTGTLFLGYFAAATVLAMFLGYLAAAIMLTVSVWVVITIQDEKHENRYGYWDFVLSLLNLAWISLAFPWGIIAAIVLTIAFIVLGIRFTPPEPKSPLPEPLDPQDPKK